MTIGHRASELEFEVKYIHKNINTLGDIQHKYEDRLSDTRNQVIALCNTIKQISLENDSHDDVLAEVAQLHEIINEGGRELEELKLDMKKNMHAITLLHDANNTDESTFPASFSLFVVILLTHTLFFSL
jgi:hypothetical protein